MLVRRKDKAMTIEKYAQELKELLDTDYVGVVTDTQLKMGVSTLQELVEELRLLRWYTYRYLSTTSKI